MGDEGNQLIRKIEDQNASAPVVVASFAYLKISDEAIEWIANSAGRSNVLTRLFLEHNLIGGEGGAMLARLLHTNPPLQELHLGSNCVDATGVVALAEALKVNTNLRSLSLAKNDFTDESAAQLATSLAGNTSITHLDLSDNALGIGDLTVAAFGTSLVMNETLETLDLFGGSITDTVGHHLSQILTSNTALKSLNLGCNQLGDTAGISIAEALSNNASLTQLLLTENLIGDESALALVRSLSSNGTLTCLNLGMNKLTEQGVGVLDSFRVKSLKEGLNTVKYLNLYDNPGTGLYYANVWATNE